MNANNSEPQPLDLAQGLPIYDNRGVRLGIVSALGVQEQYLIMTEDRPFHRDAALPVSAIERSDTSGVFLNRSQQEIRNLTLGGWSSLGNVDLNTGEPASGSANPRS